MAATADKQASIASRTGAAPDDIDKARRLQKAIAQTLTSGDPAGWRRLALAFDVIDVGGTLLDNEPEPDSPVDSTMPEAQPMTTASKTETRSPRYISVDETVTIEDMDFDDESGPRGTVSRPAGSTLIEGNAPSGSYRPHRATVPIQMPAQVTPTSAVASSHEAASSHRAASSKDVSSQPAGSNPAVSSGGTAHMQAVPSSVLDIEKYAVLCAWTQVHSDRRPQLHEQYGLADEAARRELDARFAALFASNFKLKAAFDKRLQLHLRFLQR
jgi:hypothetical protein